MDQSGQIKRTPNPRETANLFSEFTFWYTGKLFVKGFKKDLEDHDLYEVVNSCRSQKCADKLEHAYQAGRDKGKPSILRLLWNCYGVSYIILGLFNLAYKLISSNLEPEAISQLVGYFRPGQTKLSMNDALYSAGILLAIKLLTAVYHSNYTVYIYQLGIQIKAAFSSLIYRKALRLSPTSLQKTGVGNIVTVISKDVSQFDEAIVLFNEVWIGSIQTIYVCYLINMKVGFSSTLGVLILSAAIPIQYFVSIKIRNLRLKMNKMTDERLQETQEALSTIKIIKMYTWERIFIGRVNTARSKEVKILLKKYLLKLGLLVISDFMAKIGFYVIVLLYIYVNTTVNVEIIFYVMKLFSTLRRQIASIFTFALTLLADLQASLSRIQNILSLEELPAYIDKPDAEPQIDIREGSVNLKDKDILKNVSLKLKAGLTVITGRLGSGKSALIKVILRDYPLDSGDLRTRGRLSYASQDAWLFPGTIKQNILFGEKYDFERYNKVIEICALSFDLSMLEKGDDTVVQDRGMNLSKGQQARINLARAMYKDSEIYLIDDVLTALDAKVQDHIFTECIENFLKGKIVVLVTHNPKHIARSDKVVLLDAGCIKYVGDQNALSKQNLEALEEESTEPNQQEEKTQENEICEHSKLIISSSSGKKHIYSELKKEGGIALNVYLRYIKFGGGVFMLITIFVFSVFTTLTDSSSQVMLTDWVNHQSKYSGIKDIHFGNASIDVDRMMSVYFSTNVTNNSQSSEIIQSIKQDAGSNSIPISHLPTVTHPEYNVTDKEGIYAPVNLSALNEYQNETYHVLLELEYLNSQSTKAINLYTVTLMASVVFGFIQQYCVYKFGNNASINLHKRMISSIIYGRMSFFDNVFIGNILNRFSQDLTVVDERLPHFLGLIINVVFSVAGIIGMMIHVSWEFLVPSIAFVVLLIVMKFMYMPTARSLKRLEAATCSPLVGHLNSSMEGLTTIRAYKAKNILENEFDNHQDVYISARFTSLCAINAYMFYMNILGFLLNLYVLVRFLFIDIDTQAGDVGLTLTQVGSLLLVLQFGFMEWIETENALTSVERAMEYTTVEPEHIAGQQPANWPNNGEVVFSNVSLKYSNSNEKVLSDISFKVMSREKIGIVGRTGAGKSSIFTALFRLYSHEGTIHIDGIDSKTLFINYLRQHISIIPQDPIIFSGTIRTNIDPFSEFTDEEIWNVLQRVHIDTKVTNLRTLVEDINFSSGERQLLSLARAIVRKNKIVVLDEATANMDPETEQLVQKAIDENFSGCTVFIIAHRFDCIKDCNKVMVLSRGTILEYDDPIVLLRNPESAFAKMMKVDGNSTPTS